MYALKSKADVLLKQFCLRKGTTKGVNTLPGFCGVIKYCIPCEEHCLCSGITGMETPFAENSGCSHRNIEKFYSELTLCWATKSFCPHVCGPFQYPLGLLCEETTQIFIKNVIPQFSTVIHPLAILGDENSIHWGSCLFFLDYRSIMNASSSISHFCDRNEILLKIKHNHENLYMPERFAKTMVPYDK